MGYPTDIRHHTYAMACGCDGAYNDSGTPVAAGASVAIKQVYSKAGQVLRVEFATRYNNMQCYLKIDSEYANVHYSESPMYFMNKVGCCAKVAYVNLVRYDTVNNRYLYVIEGPLPFGNTFEVLVQNPSGSSQRVYALVNWMENA